MTFSTHEISSAQCFNMNEGTPSGPLTLLVSRSDNNFLIPSSEKLISGILGIGSSKVAGFSRLGIFVTSSYIYIYDLWCIRGSRSISYRSLDASPAVGLAESSRDY